MNPRDLVGEKHGKPYYGVNFEAYFRGDEFLDAPSVEKGFEYIRRDLTLELRGASRENNRRFTRDLNHQKNKYWDMREIGYHLRTLRTCYIRFGGDPEKNRDYQEAKRLVDHLKERFRDGIGEELEFHELLEEVN